MCPSTEQNCDGKCYIHRPNKAVICRLSVQTENTLQRHTESKTEVQENMISGYLRLGVNKLDTLIGD